MTDDTVAQTYARALLDAAVDGGVLEDVLEEVSFFADRLREDRQLRLFVENPRLEKVAKKNVLTSALRGKTTDTFLNFLVLTIDKGRQMFVVDMLEEFKSLYDDKVGIVRAEAISAVPMSSEAVASLVSTMNGQLQKQIVVTNKIDPDILGGLVVRFSGMVADGSLRTSLEEIRSTVIAAKFGSELVHED